MSISKCLTALLISMSYISLYAQVDPVLIKINGNEIKKSEFEYAYNKTRSGVTNNNQTIDQFLQSYIDFKLKIEEAKSLGINKNEDFKKEYAQYLEEIQEPYMTDTISPQQVAKVIYDRLDENIEISQIFIAFPNKLVLPKDTLDAYNKISSIREKVLKGNNEEFENLALKFSNDSVSRNATTPGYGGWKTSLMVDSKLEDVMYQMEVGSISQPVRTNYGYHLIKVLNKRPDLGQVNLSHIFFRYPKLATKSEIDSIKNNANIIYEGLLDGANFEQTAEVFSSDSQTANKGGSIGWFDIRKPIPVTLNKTLSQLEVGEVSPPIEMDYGIHIFKIAGKKEKESWDNLKVEIKESISNSTRSNLITKKKTELLEKDYSFSIISSTYDKLRTVANTHHIGDSIYFEKTTIFDDLTLVKIGEKSYKVIDFVNYLISNPSTYYSLSTDILSDKIDDFILLKLQETRRENLDKMYPELKLLSRDYYEGILFFEVMSKEIWDKAQNDKESLLKMFEENPLKYKFTTPRYKGYVIHTKNKVSRKKAEEIIKNKNTDDNFIETLNSQLNSDSINNIYIEKGLWAKGDNGFVDRLVFKTKNKKEMIGFPETIVAGKLLHIPEELNDVRGVVTEDYQTLLENEWIELLRNKYKVEINKDLIDQMK